MSGTKGKKEFDSLRIEMWVSGTANTNKDGGYCVMLHSAMGGQHYKKTLGGYGKDTTVTRMTLKAVLEGLKEIKKKAFVHIYTGIPQVSAGLNKLIHQWAKNDFKKANGDQLKHEDLWRQIHALLESKTISYKVHYMADSPAPENNIEAIHISSEYAMKAKQTIYETAIAVS
ncbi:hypothetical protein PUW25_25635 (plasmid) [Paenibacillus urinalis]|uniref:RNase H type-1 domain-containing protein n=1 Tax=Paenibacillus urinalis TaxID=521520 RepID=A0ABY7XHG0_9BACL|nr:RNase H family protein [Paenibacillus urinalis]WDI05194.1 hypothetical protein PUW25_25635 [Paenibacillus urinalis]